jgi:ubiquinone/menaquinone biosynthesis C-methylase UbiE
MTQEQARGIATVGQPAEKLNAAHAAAWHKWFHIIEAGAQTLSDRMIERAGVAPGQRVLDLATGMGEPAVTAARRVGPRGWVEAVDLSADMLEFGRRRAVDLGLGNIAFRQGDAAALDLAAASFDAVLCRWGLMFMADLERILAALHDCLKPGGGFAVAVWGPPEHAPALSLGARVIRKALAMPPPDEGADTPFAWADVAALEQLIAVAGFRDLRTERVDVTFRFESPEQFVAFRKDRSGALIAKIADHPAGRQAAAWRALGEAARCYQTADGEVQMDNRAYLVSARR